MLSRNALLVVLCCMFVTSIAVAAHAQTLPITHNSYTYFVNYDAGSRALVCAANAPDRTWKTAVSNQVGEFRDFAAIATAASPVIVYSEGNQTLFVLVHFRAGSTTVERSGESLRGSIGAGWLLNCMMQKEEYGAKVICQTVVGSTIHEYKWDINMWGTHKLIEHNANAGTYTPGAAPKSQGYSNAALQLSADVPHGFRPNLNDANTLAMYGPSDGVFMTLFSDAGATPIAELGDAYMQELGVTVTHRSNETLPDDRPALLLMGNGTIDEAPSLHAALIFSSATRTYVFSYTGRKDIGDAYLPAFAEIMNSFNPM